MTAAAASPLPTRATSGLKPEVALLFGLWMLLSVASGYRWFGLGRDYILYLQFYDNLAAGNFFRDNSFEPLFVAAAWTSKYALQADFQVFMTMLVALSLGIKLRLIYRLTQWPLLACLTYLAMFYMLHEYTQIRQSLAIAFGLLSIDSYIRRRFLRSLLFIGIGISFQSSIALLGFGVILFNLLVLGRVGAAIGLVALVSLAPIATSISSVLFIATYVPNFAVYVTDALQYQPLNIASGPNILFAAMLMVVTPLVSPADRSRMMYLIMCFLAVVSFIALLDFPVLAQRFRDLYAVFGILLAFSFQWRSFGMLAALLMLLSGGWSLYRVGDLLQE